MMYIKIILILFFVYSCSFNDSSKYWNEHNDKRIAEQKKLSEILKKKGDITTMSLNEYYIYIDHYTKKSKYPDITND